MGTQTLSYHTPRGQAATRGLGGPNTVNWLQASVVRPGHRPQSTTGMKCHIKEDNGAQENMFH